VVSSILNVHPLKVLTVILIIICRLQKLGKEAVRTSSTEVRYGKISELEVRKQNQMKISNRFAALVNLNDSDDIKKNTKTSAKESVCLYELKQYTQWFDEECCRFLDQRKQAKMQQRRKSKQYKT